MPRLSPACLPDELARKFPDFARELHLDEEEAAPVPALYPGELRRLLQAPANLNGSLIIVLGFGDGSVLRAMLRDQFCRCRELYLLILPGEGRAFARILGDQQSLTMFEGVQLHLAHIVDEDALESWFNACFRQRSEIMVRLAGGDLVADHPLAPQVATLRDRLRERLNQLIDDCPSYLGNDVIDTFTGLAHAARNARALLSAPSLGEMRGWAGSVPVISIAAGPSLAGRIDQLRRLQNKCVLVACDAVYHGLLDAGIDPHFVTPMERAPEIVPMLSRAAGSRAIFAGLPVVQPVAVQPFGDRTIGLYCYDLLYNWLWPECDFRVNAGFSTGVLSVTVASALGNGPVYLVGHDLAFSANGSHWSGAAVAGEYWREAQTQHDSLAAAPAESGHVRRRLPGNDGGLVESVAHWDRFLQVIAITAGNLAAAGREMINVNAHDRIYARIPYTVAAPLPDPDSLPDLPPLVMPSCQPARHAAWRARLAQLPEDIRHLRTHLAATRKRIATLQRRQPPWPANELDLISNILQGVSPGNIDAIEYLWRSAKWSCMAEAYEWSRCNTPARSNWRMVESIDNFCDAADRLFAHLQPECERLVHDCA